MRTLKRARDVIGVEGTEGRNPFEQLMLLWSVLTLLSVPAPDSVVGDLPSWAVMGCYILLCIGGLVGLVGVWLKNQIQSLLVERAAMIVVGPSALFFAGAILSQAPHNTRALSTGANVLLFSLAAFWRGYRVQSFLHGYRIRLREAAKSE